MVARMQRSWRLAPLQDHKVGETRLDAAMKKYSIDRVRRGKTDRAMQNNEDVLGADEAPTLAIDNIEKEVSLSAEAVAIVDGQVDKTDVEGTKDVSSELHAGRGKDVTNATISDVEKEGDNEVDDRVFIGLIEQPKWMAPGWTMHWSGAPTLKYYVLHAKTHHRSFNLKEAEQERTGTKTNKLVGDDKRAGVDPDQGADHDDKGPPVVDPNQGAKMKKLVGDHDDKRPVVDPDQGAEMKELVVADDKPTVVVDREAELKQKLLLRKKQIQASKKASAGTLIKPSSSVKPSVEEPPPVETSVAASMTAFGEVVVPGPKEPSIKTIAESVETLIKPSSSATPSSVEPPVEPSVAAGMTAFGEVVVPGSKELTVEEIADLALLLYGDIEPLLAMKPNPLLAMKKLSESSSDMETVTVETAVATSDIPSVIPKKDSVTTQDLLLAKELSAFCSKKKAEIDAAKTTFIDSMNAAMTPGAHTRPDPLLTGWTQLTVREKTNVDAASVATDDPASKRPATNVDAASVATDDDQAIVPEPASKRPATNVDAAFVAKPRANKNVVPTSLAVGAASSPPSMKLRSGTKKVAGSSTDAVGKAVSGDPPVDGSDDFEASGDMPMADGDEDAPDADANDDGDDDDAKDLATKKDDDADDGGDDGDDDDDDDDGGDDGDDHNDGEKGRKRSKRVVGSGATSIKQMKDAIVRKQAAHAVMKIQTLQKMTAYASEKQAAKNPKSLTFLVHYDEIVQKPDQMPEGERERERPLLTLMMGEEVEREVARNVFEKLVKILKEPPEAPKPKAKEPRRQLPGKPRTTKKSSTTVDTPTPPQAVKRDCDFRQVMAGGDYLHGIFGPVAKKLKKAPASTKKKVDRKI